MQKFDKPSFISQPFNRFNRNTLKARIQRTTVQLQQDEETKIYSRRSNIVTIVITFSFAITLCRGSGGGGAVHFNGAVHASADQRGASAPGHARHRLAVRASQVLLGGGGKE